MEPVKVMVCRFPYGGTEHPDVCDWLVGAVIEMKEDPRIAEIMRYRIDDTPITMGRNRALNLARRHEADFLLMIDSDMSPDAYLPTNPNRIGVDKNAQPFWRTSFQHVYKQRENGHPSVIASPYCGPPPIENIYVFHWETKASDVPEDDAGITLEQYSRWEAYHQKGIAEVAALPTGLILLDVKCLDKLQQPYTYYEMDDNNTEKQSTEDVTFTRDLAMQGVPLFCNWDSWSGHWKRKCVGRPSIIDSRGVGKKYRNTVLAEHNIGPGERLIHVQGNGRYGQGSPGTPVVTVEAQRSRAIQQHRVTERAH